MLLIATALVVGRAFAGPQGELDPSFGDNGRLLIFENRSPYVLAVANQPDGKLLIADHNFIVRLNSDHSWDAGFGEQGRTEIGSDSSFGDASFLMTELAVQADGKIVAAGEAQRFDDLGDDVVESHVALARFNPDGTADSTFGTNGHVVLDLGGTSDTLSRLMILEDGRIVLAATREPYGAVGDVMFIGLDAEGALDTRFGTGPAPGTTLVESNSNLDQAFWMDRQADGKLVTCGGRYVPDELDETRVLVIRANADGSLDSTFGAAGISLVGIDGGLSDTRCLSLSDGTTVVAASVGDFGTGELRLIRLLGDGTQDMDFGNGGISRIDPGAAEPNLGLESLESIILLVDGRVAISGRLAPDLELPWNEWDLPLMFVAALDSGTGLLDPGFGIDGVTKIDFGYGDFSAPWHFGFLVRQAGGRFVAVSGVQDSESEVAGVALAGVNPAGTGHPGYAGFNGNVHLPEPGSDGSSEAVVGVRRTGGSTGTLSVDYHTVGITALASRDFAATSGTLIWTSGDSETKLITIPITKGATGRFALNLDNSTGGLATSSLEIFLGPDPQPEVTPEGSGGGSIHIGLLALLALWAVRNANQTRRYRYDPWSRVGTRGSSGRSRGA